MTHTLTCKNCHRAYCGVCYGSRPDPEILGALGSAIWLLNNADIIRFPDQHERFLELARTALADCRAAYNKLSKEI